MPYRAVTTAIHTIEQKKGVTVPPFIELSRYEHTAESGEAGSTTITVTANIAWVTECPSWINVTPATGDEGVTIAVISWGISDVIRSGVITFGNNGVTVECALSQEPVIPTVTATPTLISDIPGTGGTYVVEVQSNVAWSYRSYSQELSITQQYTNGYNGTLTVTIDRSYGGARSAELSVTWGEGEELRILMRQLADRYVVYTYDGELVDRIVVGPSAGSVDIVARSSTNNLAGSGFTEDGVYAMDVRQEGMYFYITLHYAATTAAHGREMEFRLKGDYSETVYVDVIIAQTAEAVVVNRSNLNPWVPYDSGILDLLIDTDKDWVATCADSWLSPAVQSGTGAQMLSLNYTAKPDENIRRSTVVVSSPSGSFDDVTVNVRQIGVPSGIVQEEGDIILLNIFSEFAEALREPALLPLFGGEYIDGAQNEFGVAGVFDSITWQEYLDDPMPKTWTPNEGTSIEYETGIPGIRVFGTNKMSYEPLSRLYANNLATWKTHTLGVTTNALGKKVIEPYITSDFEPGIFQLMQPSNVYRQIWAAAGAAWIDEHGATPPNNMAGTDENEVSGTSGQAAFNSACTSLITKVFQSEYIEKWGDPYLNYCVLTEGHLDSVVIYPPKRGNFLFYVSSFGRQNATGMKFPRYYKLFGRPISSATWNNASSSYSPMHFYSRQEGDAFDIRHNPNLKTVIHETQHVSHVSGVTSMLGDRPIHYPTPDIYYESLFVSGPLPPPPIGRGVALEGDAIMSSATFHGNHALIASQRGWADLTQRVVSGETVVDIKAKSLLTEGDLIDYVTINHPTDSRQWCILRCNYPQVTVMGGCDNINDNGFRGIVALFVKDKPQVGWGHGEVLAFSNYSRPVSNYTNFDMVARFGYSSIDNMANLNVSYGGITLKRQARAIDVTLGLCQDGNCPSSITDEPFGITVDWVGWVDAEGGIIPAEQDLVYYQANPTVVPTARVHIKFEVTTDQ